MIIDFTLEDIREVIREEIRETIRETIQKALVVPKNPDALLTRKEAAEYLTVKENTLAVWAMQGRGPPPVKLGSSTRYRRSVLDRFINANTMPR